MQSLRLFLLQCPFTAEYVVALHKKILTDAVQFPSRCDRLEVFEALHSQKLNLSPLYFSPEVSDEAKQLISRMLEKNPDTRITLTEVKVVIHREKPVIGCIAAIVTSSRLQVHPWVTSSGSDPLLSESDAYEVISVSDEEVRKSVTVIPKLETLVSWTMVVLLGLALHIQVNYMFSRRSW